MGALFYSLVFGGQDWDTVYKPAVDAGFSTFLGVANPPYILLLFEPLARLPSHVGAAMIVGATMVAFRLAEKLSGANRWLILASYPALWMIKMAQIDALVLLGAALGYWAIKSRKPYWQGVATLLLCLKPQVGLLLALFYLWQQRNWRSLVITSAVLALSMLLIGPWPASWIHDIAQHITSAETGEGFFLRTRNSIGLFPYGIVFALAALALPGYSLRQRSAALLAGSMLSAPYVGYYSILSAMAFPMPLLIYPLISLPIVGPIGWWAVVAPVAIVIYPFAMHVFRRIAWTRASS